MKHMPFQIVAALSLLLVAACAPASGTPAAAPKLEAGAPTASGAAPSTPAQSPEALLTAQAEAFSAGAPLPSATPPLSASSQAPADAAPPPTPAADGAQPAGQQVAMQQEAFLAGPPSYALTNRCVMPGATDAPRSATWIASLDMGLLCLFGFGENEVVRYEVRDSAGRLVVAGEGSPDNMDGDPLPSVKVMVSIAENAPGKWTVKALGAKDGVESAFEVQPLTLDGNPAVILALSTGPGPVPAGGEVILAAYGLPQGGAASVGVYAVLSEAITGSKLRLHESARLQADAAGQASVTLTLDPSYKPGGYCVVLAAAPDYEPTRELSTGGATRCFEVTK